MLHDTVQLRADRKRETDLLKEMKIMTPVKRWTAADKQVIKTHWVVREKDGRVKSRLVTKDVDREKGEQHPEMFSPTPSTLSLKTILGTAHTIVIRIQMSTNHIAVGFDVLSALLNADIDQDLCPLPREDHEGFDEKPYDAWKLHNVLYKYSKERKQWHQHVISILETWVVINF